MAGTKFQCPSCGQRLEAPEEAAGCPVACPVCQSQFRVPFASSAEPASTVPSPVVSSTALCAICQTSIQAGEAVTPCPACRAEYHTECWQENGGCAVYGCEQVPAAEQRLAIEIPISYWGQDNKPCPSCGREILAAAVRCRHCGATFSSARPEDTDEFQQNVLRRERTPAMKRIIVWLFILSVVPCFAPLGAIWGLIWYPPNREHIRALPSIFPALCKIALAVALGQCGLIALMAVLYALTQNR